MSRAEEVVRAVVDYLRTGEPQDYQDVHRHFRLQWGSAYCAGAVTEAGHLLYETGELRTDLETGAMTLKEVIR